jgi:phosphoribosylpyrophosphate synthetase
MYYHDNTTQGVEDRIQLIHRATQSLELWMKDKKIKRDQIYMVGMGTSGVATASVLSWVVGCRWGFVRKETDNDHHGSMMQVYGIQPNDIVVLVDDVVCTGKTMDVLAHAMKEYRVRLILTIGCALWTTKTDVITSCHDKLIGLDFISSAKVGYTKIKGE